ncbi:MAG: vanadium-dependent haloperoxidase [Xenococcaceae cyanobacterium MO_188.B19]|nr:vanadium-dependent haloperoxidase [Xenococcaceae cyanobacterium MO_188.B19]
METRRQQAKQIRINAAELAASRPHPRHISNGEEFEYRRPTPDGKNEPSYIANFTKGLPHNPDTGFLLNSADYRQFVLGIQSGDPQDFAQTPLGPISCDSDVTIHPGCLSPQGIKCDTADRQKFWQSKIAKTAKKNKGAKLRAWESAGAGLTFDLEGADAQAVTMPPAPTLDSVELAAEMAEVYLQALLRDVHFSQFRDSHQVTGTPVDSAKCGVCEYCPPQINVDKAIEILNNVKIGGLNWFNSNCCDLTEEEQNRNRTTVNRQNIFRGIAPGDDKGPYLSQFLLIGNGGVNPNDSILTPADGLITYGSIRVDQRVRVATPCKDYMTTFEAWVDVQNAADVRNLETYINDIKNECDRDSKKSCSNREFPAYRFITTPRDLATYVHYDALYEAYLNACLIMLGMEVPFDPGLPFQGPDKQDKQQGFAQFGGPHILSLVCEVATRGLKAVRYQKFNTHRRLRPEALGGLIDRYKNNIGKDQLKPIHSLVCALDKVHLLEKVKHHNKCQNDPARNYCDARHLDPSASGDNYFLPMAFPEGSPMHPSYGAGHATVAGACVTILKAFFDHGYELSQKQGNIYIAYEPNQDGSGLNKVTLTQPLTIEGELNKLAANISIGRDWAGVHYFTDYIESLRLGEQIAISILEEQKLTYGENFTMTVPLFDGGTIRI